MSRHPTRTLINKTSRKLHRWGAILIALPLLVVIGSGIILQLKKEFAWIQPPTQRGQERPPTLSLDDILMVAMTEPKMELSGWDDVDRLDVRPGRGIVKVRGRNRWEVQIDLSSGEILHSAYRRTDLIESIHDGTFFHDKAKLWIFFPSGVILLLLWLTGIYLWALPIVMKRKGKAIRQYREKRP